MKYDDKYPDNPDGHAPEPYIVKSLHAHQSRLCKVCDDETRWFHRVFIEHVCSEECTQALERMN